MKQKAQRYTVIERHFAFRASPGQREWSAVFNKTSNLRVMVDTLANLREAGRFPETLAHWEITDEDGVTVRVVICQTAVQLLNKQMGEIA